jgi:hypothetical protein
MCKLEMAKQLIAESTAIIHERKMRMKIDDVLVSINELKNVMKQIEIKREIRAARKTLLFDAPSNRSRGYYIINRIGTVDRLLIGKVRHQKNFFLNFQKILDKNAWKDSKKPLSTEKHYGLEIELFTEKSFTDIATIASELRLKNHLAIGSDGSIRPDKSGELGYELRLCIPKSELEKVLAKVEILLNKIEAKVNKSCGLHVHFDMRNTSNDKIEEIYQNIKLGMPLLKKSVDPQRLKNTYCKFSMSSNSRIARVSGTRYKAINMTALQRYSTIEVRAFQGTTDTNLIYNFIVMMDKIMETKSPFKRAPSSFKTLEKIYGKQVVDFVKQQENKYKQVA